MFVLLVQKLVLHQITLQLVKRLVARSECVKDKCMCVCATPYVRGMSELLWKHY